MRNKITDGAENVEYRQGIAVSWVGNGSPRVSTSSYAGEIQASYYRFDMARMSEGMLEDLMFGDIWSKYLLMYETITQMQCIALIR